MLDPTYRAPPDPEPRPEPVFNIPGSVLAVLALLVGIHVLRQAIPAEWDGTVLFRLAFEPGALTDALDPARMASALAGLAEDGAAGREQAEFSRFLLDRFGFGIWTPLTYGLLHADWTHLGLNAVWLLAFGTPVARRLGAVRFLGFLAGGTIAGAAVHWLTHLTDMQPVIGASAAVSGCMGAAARFLVRPREALPDPIAPGGPTGPSTLLTLGAMARDVRIVGFLGAWMVTNLLFGLGSTTLGLGSGPVAWQAHIGGFLFGLLLLPYLERRVAPSASRT